MRAALHESRVLFAVYRSSSLLGWIVASDNWRYRDEELGIRQTHGAFKTLIETIARSLEWRTARSEALRERSATR